MPINSGLTDAELVKLFHTGHSDVAIAKQFGITKQAVSKRRVKLGLIRKRVAKEVSEGLATRWEILTPAKGATHYKEHHARALRIWLRMQLGDQELSEGQQKLARDWVRELGARGEVLCYDPQLQNGWYYRTRTPEDERRVIDWPADLPYPSERFKRALDLPPWSK